MRIDYTQMEFIDKKLRDIIYFLEKNTGIEFTATSLCRMNDPGVHGQIPLRGVDLRIRDKAIGSMIESLINSHMIYDQSRPEKKCAFMHGEGSNLHIHLQTHSKTIQRL